MAEIMETYERATSCLDMALADRGTLSAAPAQYDAGLEIVPAPTDGPAARTQHHQHDSDDDENPPDGSEHRRRNGVAEDNENNSEDDHVDSKVFGPAPIAGQQELNSHERVDPNLDACVVTDA